ncbi:hypothetical protein BpHYR1_024659 [Brachionus plicatilis]|uniref:Uncharacterized protein n=1 Tax=Brachionus plicatilis TaxID=10195 RepID=A0A3M7R1R4_BRAPC|nr:hypothetical protein BpHYR1_024659 [Brachionus plicatilis]
MELPWSRRWKLPKVLPKTIGVLFQFFLFGLISGRECRIFESKKHFYCFKVCTELICHIISDTRSIASLILVKFQFIWITAV